MREVFTHTGDAREAVLAGMRDSGGVVTAARLIMISVFTVIHVSSRSNN
ncbi:hypothetical protein [Peribacillus simplex]